MKIKKIIAGVVVAGILGTAGIAYAAEYKTPAEIVSGLTGMATEKVIEERQDGTRYGTQAEEAGKLEEFKAAMLEQRKAQLDELVKEGKLTREEADARLKAIEENMANCIGDGSGARMGGGKGMMFGRGNGQGIGNGQGRARGMRNGCGLGLGAGTRNN